MLPGNSKSADVGLTTCRARNWKDIQSYLHYFDYLVAALIIAGAAYLVVRWRRGRGDAADAPAT